MAFFNYPGTIDKNTKAVAAEVQTNFDTLLAWVLDNLVQKDGSVSMTGPLVLAPGAPGSPDQAANKAYVDATMPVGVMMEYAGASLPTNWLWCDGATYTNTSKPALAAAIARNFTAAGVPAGSFQVPDKRGKVAVGADAAEAAVFGLGVKGGQRNSELLSHAHTVPAHGHGHSISASGSSNAQNTDHVHDFGTGTGSANHAHSGTVGRFVQGGGGGDAMLFSNTAHNFSGYGPYNLGDLHVAGADHTHSGQTAGAHNAYPNAQVHSHTITVSIGGGVSNNPGFATLEQSAGGGATLVDKNLPPYIAVNYIIYAGA